MKALLTLVICLAIVLMSLVIHVPTSSNDEHVDELICILGER